MEKGLEWGNNRMGWTRSKAIAVFQVTELDGTCPYPRSPVMAVVLFTAGFLSLGLPFTQPQGGQKHSGWEEERKEEVHLVVDDEPLRVDDVTQGQAGGHFPGIHEGHMVSKGSSEERVHLEGEPVATVHRLVAGVGQFDDHQGSGLPGQQCSHGCPDLCQSLHKDGQKKGGEVGAQAPPWCGGPQPGPAPLHGPPIVMRPLVCGGSAGASCAFQCRTMPRAVSTAIREPN